MSQADADLYDIIRQLRAELEWAARTGIIVEHVPLTASPPRPSPPREAAGAAPSAEAGSSPSVEAGRRGPADRGASPSAEAGRRPPVEAGSPSEERRSPPPPSSERWSPPPPSAERPSPPSPSDSRASPPWADPRAAGPESLSTPPPPRPSFGPPTREARPTPKPEAPRGPPAWQSKFDPKVGGDPDGRKKTEEALVVLGDRPSLGAIREVLGACTRCKLHGMGRKQIVFGVGNPEAELMFVGEGPGAEEDRLGEPFVGAAGQLLTKIIEAGMGLPRSDVYIANVLKCRPPNNRDPEPDEVEQCEPFLRAQIRSVRPKVIVALGKHAAHALLKVSTPITRLRGNWMTYEGVPLMPTYHPAYLLRNPNEKRAVWEDMKEVLKRLGRAPPERGAGS